jgi:hypothetical protein
MIQSQSSHVLSAYRGGDLQIAPQLVPLDASFDLTSGTLTAKLVTPGEGEFALPRGIRVFNGAREVAIHSIRVNDIECLRGRIDAAAYNLGNELPPLEPPRDDNPPYAGELLRFCAVDHWPVFAKNMPLIIEAQPFGNPHPADLRSFDAIVVVELHQPGPALAGFPPYPQI